MTTDDPRTALVRYREQTLASEIETRWEVVEPPSPSGRSYRLRLMNPPADVKRRIVDELEQRDWRETEWGLEADDWAPNLGLLSPPTTHDALSLTTAPRGLRLRSMDPSDDGMARNFLFFIPPVMALLFVGIWFQLGWVIILAIVVYFVPLVPLFFRDRILDWSETREFERGPARMVIEQSKHSVIVTITSDSFTELDTAKLLRAELHEMVGDEPPRR